MHLWLITDPLELDEEKDFYREPSDQIEGRFPEDGVWVHVLNPRHHRGDVRDSLHQGAEQISLRAA